MNRRFLASLGVTALAIGLVIILLAPLSAAGQAQKVARASEIHFVVDFEKWKPLRPAQGLGHSGRYGVRELGYRDYVWLFRVWL